jgi:hypothetical protein
MKVVFNANIFIYTLSYEKDRSSGATKRPRFVHLRLRPVLAEFVILCRQLAIDPNYMFINARQDCPPGLL